MKINTLLEYTSPSSQPNQAGGQAPEFGRDPNVLETTAGATGSGSVATVSNPVGGVQRRGGKGSMFQGIKTSKKFVNSPVTEDEISEEQLLTKELRKELFNKAKDRDIGNRPEDREIMSNDPEYDDEAGMVASNLHTALRAVQGLHKVIGPNENLPEWVQEKIAIANDYLVTCWDYMISQHEQGRKYEVDEASSDKYFMPGGGASFGRRGREDDEYHVPDPVDPNTIPYNVKVNGQVINDKPLPGRQAAIQWAKQKVSAGEIDPKATTLAPVSKMSEATKQRLDPKCWTGYKKQGTKMKGGVRVNNCVPTESIEEVAPPGDKAERMVKHIKKSYAKDGKLTPKEKSIAYATAWKAHNKGKVEEQGAAEGEGGNYYSIALQMYPHLKQFDRATVITALNNAYEEYLFHYGYEGIGPDEERSMIDRAIKGLKQGMAEGQLNELSPDLVNKTYQARQQQASAAEKPMKALWAQKNQATTAAAKAANPNITDRELSNLPTTGYTDADQPTINAHRKAQAKLDKNISLGGNLGYARYSDTRKGDRRSYWDPTDMRGQNKYKTVAEGSLEEYGDTARGQNMLAKVHHRAADRVTSKQADKDPAYARKAQQTQDRAWERLAVKEQGVAEGTGGQVVFSVTGDNGGKYEIIQHGDDFMIHANGKHIDSYGSLQRAMSVLKNEVPGLTKTVDEESKGLWANIHAKRERIKHGSGEHMRKPGSKGAPTADALRKSAK